MGKYCHKYVILFMIYYALFETLDAKHQRLSILDSWMRFEATYDQRTMLRISISSRCTAILYYSMFATFFVESVWAILQTALIPRWKLGYWIDVCITSYLSHSAYRAVAGRACQRPRRQKRYSVFGGEAVVWYTSNWTLWSTLLLYFQLAPSQRRK